MLARHGTASSSRTLVRTAYNAAEASSSATERRPRAAKVPVRRSAGRGSDARHALSQLQDRIGIVDYGDRSFAPRSPQIELYNRAHADVVAGIDADWLTRPRTDARIEHNRLRPDDERELPAAFDRAVRRGFATIRRMVPDQTWRLSDAQISKLAFLVERCSSARYEDPLPAPPSIVSEADWALVEDVLVEAASRPVLLGDSEHQRSVLDRIADWAWYQLSHHPEDGARRVERFYRRHRDRVRATKEGARPELPSALIAAISAAHAVGSPSSSLDDFPLPLSRLVRRSVEEMSLPSRGMHGLISLRLMSGRPYVQLDAAVERLPDDLGKRMETFVRQVELAIAWRGFDEGARRDDPTRAQNRAMVIAVRQWAIRGQGRRVLDFWAAMVEGSDRAMLGDEAWIEVNWIDDAPRVSRPSEAPPVEDTSLELRGYAAEADESALASVDEAAMEPEEEEPEPTAPRKPSTSLAVLRPFVAGHFVRSMIHLKLYSAARDAWELLHSRGYAPTRVMWESVIAGHTRLADVQQVEETLKLMRERGFEPDTDALVELVITHISAFDPRNALARLEGIIAGNHRRQLTTGQWLRIMRAMLKHKMVEEAFTLIDRLPSLGHPVTIELIHIVLSHCTRLDSFDVARVHSLLNLMRRHGLEPTPLTFAHVLEVILHFGRRDMAHSLLDIMARNGVPPTAAMYRKIIVHLIRAERRADVDAGVELLDLMEEQGETNMIDAAYQALIEGYCLVAGRELHEWPIASQRTDRCDEAIARAETLLRRMIIRQHMPNQVTYMFLVRALLASGRVGDAVRHFERMRQERFRSDAGNALGVTSVSWYVFLSGLLRVGATDEARRWLGTMRADGFKPNRPQLVAVVREIESWS